MCAGVINQEEIEHVARLPDHPRPEAAAMLLLDDITAEMVNLEHLRIRSVRQMMKAKETQEQLQLDRAEETVNLIAMASVHPITVARALMQFGYEPFPTTSGKRFYFFGSSTVFLPNIFSYIRQLSRQQSFSTIFEGLDSAICVHIVGGTVDSFVWDFLGRFMKKTDVDIREKQSLSTSLKFTLRLTMTDIVVKVVTRPFKVVMFRQIACIVGNEPTFSTMKGLELGLKSGWTNLFSGLSTELRNVLLGAFLAFLGRYAINRLFSYHYEKSGKHEKVDQFKDSLYDVVITLMNRFTELGLSVLFQCTIGCPLDVTSKIRAIAGTGLPAAKDFPVQCRSHSGAWNFLTIKNALQNGSKWFFRIKPTGPGLLPSFNF